jgi:Zn-dependent protease with chaperone function
MDFFAQQAHVRRSTRFLVLLFVLAVLFIVAATDVVVVMAWVIWGHHHRLSPSVWAISSVAVVGFIALCSMYRIQSLSDGGRSVAESVGAMPVSPDTSDPQLRQLRNVIEEVAIASGLPVPDIYLMQDERGINAFAAGYSPSDAAICVTQGCIDQLSRDELQGVIAHEFSHVLNGDMRLNIRLMGLLFGIMVLAIIGRQMMWVGGGRGSRDGRQGLIALALLGIGYAGFFFGRLIQAGVARSRESLADASAVQFTRQTAGIAGALKKIAVLDDGSALQVGNRHEVAHMLFGEADDTYDAWYATHPPLRERIRILEPGFQNEELVQLAESLRNAPAAREAMSADTTVAPTPTPAASGAAMQQPSSQLGPPVTSVQPDQVGAGSYGHAAALQQSIPATLTSAAQQPESALSLVLALAMSAHADLQAPQRRAIANAFGDDLQDVVTAFANQVEALSPVVRMPLVALSFPALKQLPEGRQQTLLDTLDELVGMDSKVDLDEYCLARLLRVQLLEAMRPRRAPVDGQKKLPACRDSVMLVCAVVAAYGSADDAAARRAWLLAMDQAFPGVAPIWQTPALDWQQSFERALDDLDGLMPAAKEIVILSLLSAIRADGVINAAEIELLRVICASLHCPLPPQSGIQDN